MLDGLMGSIDLGAIGRTRQVAIVAPPALACLRREALPRARGLPLHHES